MKSVCPHCNCWMLAHPKLKDWLKCIACGFCKNIADEEFVKAAKEVMNTHAGLLKKLKDAGD